MKQMKSTKMLTQNSV